MTTPSFMRGIVDAWKRPLCTLHWGETRILALIDTGFNGKLFMGDELAGVLNFRATEFFDRVSYGVGSGRVSIAEGELHWKGATRPIEAFVASNVTRTGSVSEPEILIGTGLIFPDVLTVDLLDEWWKIESK